MQRVMCLSRDECLCWEGERGITGEVGGCRVRGKKGVAGGGMGGNSAGEGD